MPAPDLMPQRQTQNAQYCSDLVRLRDEDRWLAARYADARAARSLFALYAFHSELKRVSGVVSEPLLGGIRLQWWRDALTEIRSGKTPHAHPVIEEIAKTGLSATSFVEGINAAIDARARSLYGQGFSSIDDLAEWLGQGEGAVDALGARLLGGDEDLAQAAAGAGAAFALAREGPRHMPERREDIMRRAESMWKEYAPRLRAAPPATAPAILHLSLTRIYLRQGAKPFPALKRLRLFAAMMTGRI